MNKNLFFIVIGLFFILALSNQASAAISYSSGTIKVTGGKDSGTATSGTASTLADTSKSWTVNAYANRMVRITSGTGAGQYRRIASNNATALTVDVAWDTSPSSDSIYYISYNLQDIIDAGVSGITKSGNRTYIVTALINMTSYAFLHDYEKTFQCEWTSSKTPWLWDSTSAVAFGFLDSDDYGWGGCSISLRSTVSGTVSLAHPTGAGGDFLLYGNSISATNTNGGSSDVFFYRTYRSDSQICDFVDNTWMDFDGGGRTRGTNSRILRNKFLSSQKAGSPFTTIPTMGLISENQVVNSQYGLYWNANAANLTVEKLYGRGLTYGLLIASFQVDAASSNTLSLIDSDFDSLTIDWQENPLSLLTNVRVNELYNYVPTVVDISTQSAITSGRVAVYNLSGTEVENEALNGSGQVGELLLKAGSYRIATGNTRTDNTPHTIKVRCYGYQFQEFPVTMAARTKVNIGQTANSYVVADNDTASGYSSKFDIGWPSKTINISGSTTPQEMYDYIQYESTQEDNMQYDPLITAIAPGDFVVEDEVEINIKSGGTLDIDDDDVKGKLTFGELAESGGSNYQNYIRVFNGGTLITGTNGRQGTILYFERNTTSASWVEENQDILVESGGNWTWKGGTIEQRNAVWGLTGSTLHISGNAQLYSATGTGTGALRYSGTDTKITSLIMNNAALVWFVVPNTPLKGISFLNVQDPQQCVVGLDNDNVNGEWILAKGFDIFDDSIDVGYAHWDERWARFSNHDSGTEIVVEGNLPDHANNKGLLEVRQEINFTATAGSEAKYYTRDTDWGGRLASNQIVDNPDYTADRDYTLSESDGYASYTTDGGILTGVYWRTTGGLQEDNNYFDSRGINNDTTDIFKWLKVEYGQQPTTLDIEMKGTSIVEEEIQSLPDSGITESTKATVEAYTGIAGNYNGTYLIVNVTEDHSWNEVYDYIKYLESENPAWIWNSTYNSFVTTVNKQSYDYHNLTVYVDGATLTASGQDLPTKPIVSNGGFFEDSEGAIWEDSGDIYYASHVFHKIQNSTGILENTLVVYASNCSETLYNLSIDKVNALETNTTGHVEGYALYRKNDSYAQYQTITVKKYGYNTLEIPRTITGVLSNDDLFLVIDNFITDKNVTNVSLIDSFHLDSTNNKITINKNTTLIELYDYLSYANSLYENICDNQYLETYDAITYTSDLNIVLNNTYLLSDILRHLYYTEDKGYSTTELNGGTLNIDYSNWNFTWVGETNGTLYRKFTLDVGVTDCFNQLPIEDARVVVKNSEDEVVLNVTTNSTGNINKSEIVYGTYFYTNYSNISLLDPHKIIITKNESYYNYTQSIEIIYPTEINIALNRRCDDGGDDPPVVVAENITYEMTLVPHTKKQEQPYIKLKKGNNFKGKAPYIKLNEKRSFK